jgi:hypothetical protein
MCLSGIKMLLYFMSCCFKFIRCFLAEGMNAPVNIGIGMFVVITDGFNNGKWRL